MEPPGVEQRVLAFSMVEVGDPSDDEPTQDVIGFLP
jgi:hypothetical protein